MTCAAAARRSLPNASRAASAVAGRVDFVVSGEFKDFDTRWRHGRACPAHPRLSSVIRRVKTWMPGTRPGMTTTTKKKSAKPRWPLERSIPEFPTKVGGHHVTGSTDPARASSRKDRKGPGGKCLL